MNALAGSQCHGGFNKTELSHPCRSCPGDLPCRDVFRAIAIRGAEKESGDAVHDVKAARGKNGKFHVSIGIIHFPAIVGSGDPVFIVMIVTMGEAIADRGLGQTVRGFDSGFIHDHQLPLFPKLARAAQVAPEADFVDKIASPDPVVSPGLSEYCGIAGRSLGTVVRRDCAGWEQAQAG